MDDPRDKISYARMQLLWERPFFGTLVMGLKPVEIADEAEVPTAAVDGKHLFYNPSYIGKLSVPELEAVLAHEAMHCALHHVTRREMRQPMPWNLAADCCINELLARNGMEITDGVRAHLIPWREDPGDVIQRTAEELYALLPVMKIGIASSFGHKGSGKKDDGKSGKGENIDACGGIKDPIGDSPPEVEEIRWGALMEAALENAKKQGKAPAGIEQLLEKIRRPKKDWRKMLAEFVSYFPEDYSFTEPDRRFTSADDFILPDIQEGEQVEDVVVAVDTSGSISNEELEQFLGEALAIKAVGVNIWLIYCDAAVQGVHKLDESDRPPMPKGRGGTDFRPVFDYIEKDGRKHLSPRCVVYLTDAYGTYPEKHPPYPVIWILTTLYDTLDKHYKPPWGRWAELDLHKESETWT